MSASGIWSLRDIQRANGEALYGAKFDGVFDYLIVAGGGGTPEWAAGAGAGGFLMGSFTRDNNPRGTTLTSEPVVIGAGGAGGTGYYRLGSTGSDSSFLGIVAKGGGAGAGAGNNLAGGPGGSGGGGTKNGAGGAAVAGQGYPGAQGSVENSWGQSGGGGAGGPGVKSPHNNMAPHRPGPGGPGKQWVDGKYYAGGGGGATDSRNPGWQDGLGVGGIGGGGSGGSPGAPGAANTGGGGGGGCIRSAGGNGGSGVVIVRYKGRTAKLAGGVVSYDNGYTYHQFNASGTLIFL